MENQDSPPLEIVETSEGPCCVLKDDKSEDVKAELKKSLSPLPAEEQATVNAAITNVETEPEAVNADDTFAGSSLRFSTIDDDAVFTEMVSTIKANATGSAYFNSKGEIFGFNKIGGVWTSLEGAKNSNMFDVSAANDFDASAGGAFSTYESDWLSSIVKEHSQKVQTQEKDGKQYFLFDNGLNRNIVVIVFDAGEKQMVKIGNVILPLNQLFTLERCIQVDSPMPKGSDYCEIRTERKSADGSSVVCFFEDGSSVTFPSVTTTEIMYIVSHFSKVYTFDPPTQAPAPAQSQPKPTATPATAVPAGANPQEEQPDNSALFIGDALLMLGTGAFLSILSMYLGKCIV